MKLSRIGRRRFLSLAGASALAAGLYPLWPGRKTSRRPRIPVKPWRRSDLYGKHDLAG